MAGKKVLIIAEAGVNHNGNIHIAKRLIDAAAEAEADYVKFQTFVAEDNITIHALKASYQIKNTENHKQSQLEMVKKLELTPQMHKALVTHCKKQRIKFLTTAFDFQSIQLLKRYNLDLFKIPSGEITNLPYLESAAKESYPQYVMSTGMATIADIEKAIEILEYRGVSRNIITVLHCNTEYPTPVHDVNLKAMQTIKDAFKVNVGYSDHTLGIEVPIAAVALGAKIIEKHFTLDRNMKGPDHKASLEPDELKVMVKAIRNIEKAMGDGIKQPSASERKNIIAARKSLVAKTSIKKGDVFTETNIIAKRPGNGISPMKWYDIIGTKASRDYRPDDLI